MVTIPGPSVGGSYDYSEDFTVGGITNGTTLSAHNSDFVVNGGNANELQYSTAESGFEVQGANSTSWEYRAVSDGADVEIVALIRYPDWTVDDYLMPTVRRDGGGTGYALLLDVVAGDDVWELFELGVGALDTSTDLQPSPDDRIWMRVYISGTTVRARRWLEGDSEPGTWQFQGTDATSATGYPAIIASGFSGTDAYLEAIGILELGGTQTVNLDLVSETDSAPAVSAQPGSISAALASIAETDSALAMSVAPGAATRALALPTETDTALGITPAGGSVSVPLDLVTETDTVLVLAAAPGQIAGSLDLVAETDSAIGITATIAGSVVGLDLATETDTAFGITPVPGAATVGLDLVSEVDTALVITPVLGALSSVRTRSLGMERRYYSVGVDRRYGGSI